MTPVAIVETGTANLASVEAAFTRLGCATTRTRDPHLVKHAERVVLPGVGTFAAGMARLREAELCAPLRQRVEEGRPLLAVCLGLQLLCRASEESPGVEGLAVVDAEVRRFATGLIVPQLGFNVVEPATGCRWLERGHAYFANSYRLGEVPPGWCGAASDHGGAFVAAMEKGSTLACQFHPELSGAWGQALLGRWLEGEVAPC